MVPSCKNLGLLIGGFTLNLVNYIKVAGCQISWGTFLPYIASYFYLSDHLITIADFSIVPFIGKLSECLSNFLISYLSNFISLYTIVLIYSSIGCLLIFSSSYILNPILFSWVFGLAVGLLASGIFLPCVWITWNYLPENKAISSGLMLAGYSGGTVPFGILFTMIVNPHNHSPGENEDDNESELFGKEVAERVPMTIQWLSICYFSLIVIGLILIPRKAKIPESAQTTKKNKNFKEVIKMRLFWNIFFMMLLSMGTQQYVFVFYKVVALQYIKDDYYSSFIGTISFFFGTIGRMVFGVLLSKIYWKKIMSLVHFTVTLILVSFWFALEDKALYGFFLVLFVFLTSSYYNNSLLQAQKAFPDNKNAISGISISLLFSYFIPYLIDKILTPYVGYLGSFLLVASFGIILIIQLIFYDEPKAGNLIEDCEAEQID